jgi:HPt (histidine-containing phosphotransfer) domain-containing protein
MAAVSIAFSTPEATGNICPSQARPIDLVHLASQTMGDKGLEIEVMDMFSRQARRALQDMAGAETAKVRATAHRLKGAAAGIGAFRVSQAAARVEEDATDPARLVALSAAVVEAENFILTLCR